MPNDEYDAIDPEDMTKLRLIIQLFSRGSKKYAGFLADSITLNPAREIANFLIGRPSNADPKWKEFAHHLSESTTVMADKVNLVAS
jgi:hypothetical protein